MRLDYFALPTQLNLKPDRLARHQAPTLIGCKFLKIVAMSFSAPPRRCVFCSTEAKLCTLSLLSVNTFFTASLHFLLRFRFTSQQAFTPPSSSPNRTSNPGAAPLSTASLRNERPNIRSLIRAVQALIHEPVTVAHLCLKVGFRFSRNAAIPSF